MTQKLSMPLTPAKASQNSRGGKVKLGVARSNQEGHQTMERQRGRHQTGPKDTTSSNSNLPTSAAKRLCQATPTATSTPPRVNIKNNPGVHIYQAEAKVVQATIKQLWQRKQQREERGEEVSKEGTSQGETCHQRSQKGGVEEHGKFPAPTSKPHMFQCVRGRPKPRPRNSSTPKDTERRRQVPICQYLTDKEGESSQQISTKGKFAG